MIQQLCIRIYDGLIFCFVLVINSIIIVLATVHSLLYYAISCNQIIFNIKINTILYAIKIQEFRDSIIFEVMQSNWFLSNYDNVQYYSLVLINYYIASLDTTQIIERSMLKSKIVFVFLIVQKYPISIGFLNYYFKFLAKYYIQNTYLHIKNA